jgi:hypothetical protein
LTRNELTSRLVWNVILIGDRHLEQSVDLVVFPSRLRYRTDVLGVLNGLTCESLSGRSIRSVCSASDLLRQGTVADCV